ncbi:hypothetical protein [Rhodococcus sp. NPDC056516]|uniref:hypothetical protein n=1 Tax=Rhodococcus sp. NPDC056516 TaxID=3345847 RepID=UPI00366EFF42
MRGERIFAGLVVGLLLGLFGYLPLVLLWQHFADVPQPQLYPNRSFTSFGPNPPPLTYWISWAAPAAVFVILGLMTIPSRIGRQFALPLVLAFLSVAAMVAWFWISMELFFSPD